MRVRIVARSLPSSLSVRRWRAKKRMCMDARRAESAHAQGAAEPLRSRGEPMASRAGTGKRKRSSPGAERALLDALSESLSEDEIRRLLASALGVLDRAGIERLAERLGEDTARTVRRVLALRGEERQQPSKDKIREEWNVAWREWRGRVDETQGENGDYVSQDEHWEPPYLDTLSLTEDLEKIAGRMRKLLPRVFEEGLDPEFSFREEIAQTVEEVGAGLPDWMDNPEGCDFGPEVTGCLLEWERRAAERDGRDVFSVVDGVCELELSLSKGGLERDTIGDFVFGLDQGEQKAVLQGIERHRQVLHWVKVLGNVHSGWFSIYQELARRWDPERFAASCRQNIAQDWRLALPLVKDLLHKKAFTQAQPLIEEAVRALLHLGPDDVWDPRTGLLIRHCTQLYSIHDKSGVVSLLKAWRTLAKGIGQGDLAVALDLQVVATDAWEDWDRVLDAFRRAHAPELESLCNRLFADWRLQIVERCVGGDGEDLGRLESHWLCALADVARAGDDARQFHEAVRRWIEETGRTPESVRRSRRSLGVLTLDIDPGSALRREAPALRRILERELRDTEPMRKSRRGWVKRLRGSDLTSDVIELWRSHAAELVPDPGGTTGSYYDECADWMAVLFELDIDAYHQTARAWSVTHKRRRNLWRALEKRKLPIPRS